MGAFIKQLKKAKPTPSLENGKLMEMLNKAWSQGFDQGAAEQRAKDIESTVNMLEGLETINGVGEKTAWKIREHVMKQFGGNGNE